MDILVIIIAALVSLGMFFLGWILSTKIGQGKVASAEKLAEKIVSEAEKEADALKNQKILEAKDEWFKQKQNFENETRQQTKELEKKIRRLEKQENEQNRRLEHLNQKISMAESRAPPESRFTIPATPDGFPGRNSTPQLRPHHG